MNTTNNQTTIYQAVETELNPVTQTKAFSELTNRYKQINTSELIEVFEANGLSPLGISAAKPRNKNKLGFQKHIVVFSNNDLNLGNEKLQLLLTNSHDGSSSFRLNIGVFRFVCANGLVAGNNMFETRIKHSKNALNKIDIAIKETIELLPLVCEKINTFKETQLEPKQIKELLFNVAEKRFNKKPIDVRASVRRSEDTGTSAWNIYNVIQENIIKGGLVYSLDGEKYKNSRKITSIAKQVELNKFIWNETEKLITAA